MFKMLTNNDRIIALQCENNALRAKLDKATADLEYTAMMCDIDLDTDEGVEDYE